MFLVLQIGTFSSDGSFIKNKMNFFSMDSMILSSSAPTMWKGMTSKFPNWNMPRAFSGPMIPLLARVLLSDWITASCDFFMPFEVFSILAFWTCTVYSSSFPFFPLFLVEKDVFFFLL